MIISDIEKKKENGRKQRQSGHQMTEFDTDKFSNDYANVGKVFSLISLDWWILFFNATFSNISAISWWPVLVVEEPPTIGKELVNFITCGSSQEHF